jgi:hypothetical protein
LQQSFNLDATYANERKRKKKLEYRFISLDKNNTGEVIIESQDDLSQLSHNAIMEEFDALYDREQKLIYGN